MMGSKLNSALIVSTFSLVLVFGFAIVISVVSSPIERQLIEPNINRSLASTTMTPILESGIAHTKINKNFMSVFDLTCFGKFQKIDSDVKHIRIKAKLCDPLVQDKSLNDIKIAQISILNKSNGFQGTAFFSEKKFNFTSDFINLTPGKNEIIISLTTKSGESKLSQLIVNRSQPQVTIK